jgi:hypothetical protein
LTRPELASDDPWAELGSRAPSTSAREVLAEHREQVDPMVELAPAPSTARCPWCAQEVTVSRRGHMAIHSRVARVGGPASLCSGSGDRPFRLDQGGM